MVSGQPEEGVRWEELRCDLSHGVAPARAYRPERQDPDAPLLVYLHMGGGVIGDLETHHAFCTMIASIARCAVLSIDYRLAPEHRFPAGVDDSLQAVRWGRNNAARFGAPAGRVAVAGDSMGGNFAAVICQDLQRRGRAPARAAGADLPRRGRQERDAVHDAARESYPLTSAMMDWFMCTTWPRGRRRRRARLPDPRRRPVRAWRPRSWSPPASTRCRIRARPTPTGSCAGVPALHRRYDSLCHGFTAMTGAIPAADVASREIAGPDPRSVRGPARRRLRLQPQVGSEMAEWTIGVCALLNIPANPANLGRVIGVNCRMMRLFRKLHATRAGP
jgi:acetyl esterase/lipase